MTDVELRALANGVIGGTVFTDRHLHESEGGDMLSLVFTPCGLLDREQKQALLDQGCALTYERLNKARPGFVNGYPKFFSFQWISRRPGWHVSRDRVGHLLA